MYSVQQQQMTFRDLQKLVSHSQHENTHINELYQRLQGKPFWIWNIEEHKRYAECSYQGRSGPLEDQKVPPDVFHFL